MILADTSVWIDHLRMPNARMALLLDETQVLGHAFVIGELALGSLRPHHPTIIAMQNMPQAIRAADDEVMTFIRLHSLSGLGFGWIDAHLLVSTALTEDAILWTRDRHLHETAVRLGLAAA
ncbi:type II toxin-antitoxin system VapC family toxin [Asticcacaulis sp. MM231]|uniref:type II toxin-antitoxin system VapC family toxin n=1 Tax=Asticcacaulis sp. MM231 TaxID=3157666 RepID=UPI0032D5AA6C